MKNQKWVFQGVTYLNRLEWITAIGEYVQGRGK